MRKIDHIFIISILFLLLATAVTCGCLSGTTTEPGPEEGGAPEQQSPPTGSDDTTGATTNAATTQTQSAQAESNGETQTDGTPVEETTAPEETIEPEETTETEETTAGSSSGGGGSGDSGDDPDIRYVQDTVGRLVQLPYDVNGVLTTNPTTTIMVYMIAPEKLLGWNFNPGDPMPADYKSLPVVGGWFGSMSGNYETFIALGPDVIIDGANCQGTLEENIEERQANFDPIPVVGVLSSNDATHFEATVGFVGEILGDQDRASNLIEFYRNVKDEVTDRTADIPEDERRRVYYAEGADGLTTDPTGSFHAQVIDICGGVNVAECAVTPGSGKTPVSIEQVLLWNPDLIFCDDPNFAASVYTDPQWQEIDAVKNHQVFYTPYGPFSLFNTPPSTNLIPGMLWAGAVMYPDEFEDMDVVGTIGQFYSEFYHVDLTDDEVTAIIGDLPEATHTRYMTDMVGRRIIVPDEVNGVLTTNPTTTIMTYMIAPDKLLGWNFNPGDPMPADYKSLPVVGGWFGSMSGNYETFIALGPDLIIDGANCQGTLEENIEERQANFDPIPVVGVLASNDATQFETTVSFVGRVLGSQDEAGSLIEFYNEVMDEVSARTGDIPEDERRRVYYAEGADGLATDPTGSFHAQVIEICGGVNVAECAVTPGSGKTPVSIEQVLLWNPDLIFCDDPTFATSVYTDPLWENVTAVENHQVFYTPYGPFSVFNAPPSTNLIPGMLWAGEMMYPDRFADLDVEGRITAFYSEFYHYDLTPADYDDLFTSN
ncbi:ABC transporter substrate-binding protein [Methanofollis fontis]|nr:ABC transporter substrate-binding protein [Methanofollis fontis]